MTARRTNSLAAASALVCCLPLAACDPMSAPLVRHQAAFQPADDGELRIWPGQDCTRVRQVSVELEEAEGQPRDTWVLRSEQTVGATFTGLTLDEAPAGFEVSREWQDDPVWTDAKTVWVRVTTTEGQTSSYVSVGSMLEDDDHGDDEFYVEDEGWLTQDEFRTKAGDDEGIAPLCGPGTPAD